MSQRFVTETIGKVHGSLGEFRVVLVYEKGTDAPQFVMEVV